MKTYSHLKLGFLGLWVIACASGMLAHEIIVHQEITKNAAASAFTYSSAYSGFLNTIALDCTRDKAEVSLIEGSAKEDNVDKDEGGKRPYNHFYDPLTGLGLADFPPDVPIPPMGNDSFTWASTRNCIGVNVYSIPAIANIDKYNTWSWQNARDYESLGLTAANKSDRLQALTNMFRAVGQVMHLLEDTTQPQHVRNEQHLDKIFGRSSPWRSPIETYGDKNVATLNYQHALLDWKNAGFKKLEDFWNRRLYNGIPAALNADANNGAKLGLAEFSNGNFVGDRHLYPEYFIRPSVKYYPYPSRDTSTTYNQVKNNPSLGTETTTLRNGHQGKGIFITKNADGITVTHHTRINYLGGKTFLQSGFSPRGEIPFCTIRDDKVLADYHSILIPKAVEYSAGLLDYFFRGRLAVGFSSVGTGGKLEIKVMNRSGPGQTFRGGSFTVLRETLSVQRSDLGPLELLWTSTSTLADNEQLTIKFNPPNPALSAGERLVVVYKGTIGWDGTSALDPVDKDVAIAVGSTLMPLAWWKMEETASNNRVDAVNSVILTPSGGNGTVSGATGKVNGALDISSSGGGTMNRFLITSADGGIFNIGVPALGYMSPNGLEITFWLKIPVFQNAHARVLFKSSTDGVNASAFFGFHYQDFTDPGNVLLELNPVSGNVSDLFVPFNPANGSWHFYRMFVDEMNGRFGLQIDDGTVNSMPFTSPPFAGSKGSLDLMLINGTDSPGPHNGELIFDEVAVWSRKLTDSEASFLYNGGSGRTWPLTP